ncbi:FAD-dependent oxidoreductase [Bailinhaonella thermotolerans]|uniref:FAD-dependent monooxygenase n=1 Tax=Bailinhaonella thermotolerans TaxID=1070861 RepID=A0A3A4AYA5_9ACTN|nr:NAD(P)/FAD-dependent oxidoreductase [Bailinhaonella thermotolerans]RJL35652.1 FAD-dependent monooxygenase [Bailinhaonella thermotolerans]
MPGRPLHVIIIGAGTGGLCLAQGLKRAGIGVAVYERDRTRRDGLQGYRVGIDADGKRALRANLSPELYDTFLATCAQRPVYGNQMTHEMKWLFSAGPEVLREEDRPSEDDQDESVSRMTLRQVLLTGVEDVVHFDKVFTHYEQRPDGRVTAHFADGDSATGDLLVGAEGANSRVRRQYLPHARLVDTGLIGITGKTPLTDETRALLPRPVIEGVTMVHGPKGGMCVLHVMRFKWDEQGRPRQGIGATDAELIANWPGLLYDNSRDYIMWGFAASERWLPEDVMRMRGAEIQKLVLDMTGDWHPNLREIFSLGDPASSFPLRIRTSEPIPPWRSTNVTLLGDAIHTMTPGRGVGANTALRDARLLTRCLRRVADGELPLLEAVHDYETTMTGYAWDAVVKSRAQMDGHSVMHKGGLIGGLARGGMRTAMRVMNHLPPLKRRIVMAESTFRGSGRDEDEA